jgi:hypothetical protein
LSAYQVYESGWQTLASGEWVVATFAGINSSTAGYIPYYSAAKVLSNSGLYFDGTNCGIGTTGPGAKLDVIGSIQSRLASSGNSGGILLGTTATERPVIEFHVSDNSVRSKIELNDINTANERMGFFMNPFGTLNEYMSLDKNGNVGIGTVNPQDLLDIQYAAGVKLTTFRGTTNTAITGWIMYNADGEACYVYPNATQDGIIVSATIP